MVCLRHNGDGGGVETGGGGADAGKWAGDGGRDWADVAAHGEERRGEGGWVGKPA